MRGVTKSRQEPLELFFISTHTPHARRDALCSAAGSNPALFQLTRLMRGVTSNGSDTKTPPFIISTHTPHARRDWAHNRPGAPSSNFNSHASCEAWHIFHWYNDYSIDFNSHASCEAWPAKSNTFIVVDEFQLTRLMRGVTFQPLNSISANLFQLTRLMRGVTEKYIKEREYLEYFNSHASCEAWRKVGYTEVQINDFNSHASCEAWQIKMEQGKLWRNHFNSHASCEAWRPCQRSAFYSLGISTHTPHARRDFGFDFLKFINCKFQLTRLMRGVTSLAGT